jgi:hypothetical protein
MDNGGLAICHVVVGLTYGPAWHGRVGQGSARQGVARHGHQWCSEAPV